MALSLLLAVLPWVTAVLQLVPPLDGAASLLTSLYGLQCHQRDARALSLLGQALPVCARCTGLYLGLGLAVLVRRPRLRLNLYKTWLLVSAILLALDVATEAAGMRPPAVGLRVATGALLSYAVGLVLVRAAEGA